ncbi:MAG: hypothetical protein ACREA9_15670 [Pyrinomonadaceae bacterium]
MQLEDEQNKDAGISGSTDELEHLAETEHAYLQQRLREDLGREPSEEELNDWLRQHTASY